MAYAFLLGISQILVSGCGENVAESEEAEIAQNPGLNGASKLDPPAGQSPAYSTVSNKDRTIVDLGIMFKSIPSGTFIMGSPENEAYRQTGEGPMHEVTISQDFWMATTEITQQQYVTIMGTNPSHFTGDATRPVERVSWDDAVVFCEQLTLLERGSDKIPDGYEYRLPTEAEWEFCCRAGGSSNFGYGQDDNHTELSKHAWYSDNSGSTTNPVGEKVANNFGLYDMHGNVWEWCHDTYSNTYYQNSPSLDPTGPGVGSYRVFRGGSWVNFGQACRSACRMVNQQSFSYIGLGFRIVLAPVLKLYSIDGSVSGSATEGITMSLSGNNSGTALTDTNGKYRFGPLANGTYEVTPSLTGYSFNPASYPITVLGGNVTGKNFLTEEVNISGRVTGAVGEGVTLTLSTGNTVSTDWTGMYSFDRVADGEYTVTPSLDGYIFSPEQRTVMVAGLDKSENDFLSTAVYRVSGKITDPSVEAVTMTLSNGQTAITDSTGTYAFDEIPDGEYTVQPSKEGYIFEPVMRDVRIYGQDTTVQDFVPIPVYNISGQVSGDVIEGVRLTLSTGDEAMTDESGFYSFTKLVAGSYTLTPFLNGYIFSPEQVNLTVTNASIEDLDFSLTPVFNVTGSISGEVIEGVTVTISADGSTKTTTTSSDGAYSLAGLVDGTYVLHATLSGYSFRPNSRTVTINSTDIHGQNFESLQNTVLSDLDMSLVPIPAGTFIMGSPEEEHYRSSSEGPQHQVTISRDFWMAEAEVTQAQYTTIIENNPSSFTGDSSLPVENLTWEDADNFCRELTSREAFNIPSDYEYRLPTEAEWEYCCRAGTTTAFSYGDDTSSDNGNTFADLGAHAWYSANSDSRTHPVATAGTASADSANTWGLYDMHGNVSEWCYDWSDSYTSDAQTDPYGPDIDPYAQDLVPFRVERGGSCYGNGRSLRSACRGRTQHGEAFQTLGFRVVLAPILVSKSYGISGDVWGDINAGITIELAGPITVTMTTESSGRFIFSDLPDGHYTITPKLEGYNFFPTTLSATVARKSVYGMTFRAVADRVISGLGMTMKPIFAGSFTMGSPYSEEYREDNEGPQHPVTISQDFWIASTEVTQAQYSSISGSNPSGFTGDASRPVEKVSYSDAVAFCEQLTVNERNLGRVPTGYKYRLPTEAEWEYCCRAGSTSNFSYDEDTSDDGGKTYSRLGDYAWYSQNSSSTTHPVAAMKRPNAWGLYNMHGNVSEMCHDWYSAYPGTAQTDPSGPATGTYRVVRGGSYFPTGRYCRSAWRMDWDESPITILGFRVVLAPELP